MFLTMYDVLLVANTTVQLCHVYFSRCTRVHVRVCVYTLHDEHVYTWTYHMYVERRTVELFVKTKKRKKLNKLIYFISSLGKLSVLYKDIFLHMFRWCCCLVCSVLSIVIFFFSNVQVYNITVRVAVLLLSVLKISRTASASIWKSVSSLYIWALTRVYHFVEEFENVIPSHGYVGTCFLNNE